MLNALVLLGHIAGPHALFGKTLSQPYNKYQSSNTQQYSHRLTLTQGTARTS